MQPFKVLCLFYHLKTPEKSVIKVMEALSELNWQSPQKELI